MSFKIFRFNCCGLDIHKTWIYACIGITDDRGLTVYHQHRFSAYTGGLRQLASWLKEFDCSQVCMESTGKYWIPVYNVLEAAGVSVVLAHPKYTKPQKGNKTDRKDAKWICDLFMCEMIKPSFIPPADIRQLRDAVRYRFKLVCMISGEKNRAQNCLTVSNLKLDEVFSDVFGKSARSITEYMLLHPGETFDVTPFVDRRCKTPIEDIQAAVDGAISPEQAVKLRNCLTHIDELDCHIQSEEALIFQMGEKYAKELNLIRTVPGLGNNPLTAIQIISEIGCDMTVFPTAKHLCSWAGCCPRNDQSSKRIKSTKISRAGTYLKPLLVQVANGLVRSKQYPEITERYRRIRARRGHKKAIIAICRMLLVAIWHILKDGVAYTAEGYSDKEGATGSKNKVTYISKSQAAAILEKYGYAFKNEESEAG